MVAWIGLVPRQDSTGGKQKLGPMSKQGDRYLRRILVVGAHSVLRRATGTMDVVKARAQWTHAFSTIIDATVWDAAARSFDRSSPFQVSVPGIGTLTPPLPQATWAEYGARLGYKITASLTVDAFIDGVFGDHAIGSNAHVGGDLRYRF